MYRNNTMRLGSLVLSVLMVFTLSLGLVPQASAEEAAVLEARESVVRVAAYIQVKYWGYQTEYWVYTGTGFFVGEKDSPVQYVVTNNHVVNQESMLEEIRASDNYKYGKAEIDDFALWVLIDGTPYKIDYVKNVTLSQIADLAILKLNNPVSSRKAAVLGSQDNAKVTDTVFAIGYPGYADVEDINNTASSSIESDIAKTCPSGVENLSVTKGSVVKTNVVNGGISHIQHDASISNGNSGGPLVTADGAIVGVNTWASSSGIATANFAIDVSNVKTLLRQNGISYLDSADIATETQVPVIVTTPAPEQPSDSATVVTVTEEPSPSPEQEPEEESSGLSLPLIIGIAAAVLILIIVIAVVASNNKKKKQQREAEEAERQRREAAAREAAARRAAEEAQARAAAQNRLIPIVRSLSAQHGNKKVELGTDAIVIGRTNECRIIFQDGTPGVSRRHCAVTWDEAQRNFIVKDLNSTYGTFLENGTKLNPEKTYRLKPGESFYLGEKTNMIRLEIE